MSAKKVQSELGLVGDVSPNLEIMYNASTSLHDNFDKEKNENAKHDALLFIGQAYAGLPVNAKPDEHGMAVNAFITGTGNDLLKMLIEVMGHDEKLLALLSKAVVGALLRLKTMSPEDLAKRLGGEEHSDDDGPQDELLRKLMGFDPDKEKE